MPPRKPSPMASAADVTLWIGAEHDRTDIGPDPR
jgi:hypothetical protein